MMMTSTSPSRWCRVPQLLPLVAPGVVIATFVIFYGQFLLCHSDSPSCSPLASTAILAGVGTDDETRVAAYVARASWTLVNGVHLLACLAAVLTACVVIYQALSTHSSMTRWIVILIVVASAADISLLFSLWVTTDASSPAQQLLRATVAQVIPAINKYTRLTESLSLTATLSLACAGCAVLWQRDLNSEQNDAELAQRMTLLRYVLYAGATLLAIGVLRVSTTLGWGVSYLPSDSDIGKSVASLVTGIIASMGTFYTLLMGAVYIPAAL